MNKLIPCIFIMLSTAPIVGCFAPSYQHSKAAINQTQQQIKNAQQIANTPEPPVLSKPGYYIDADPVPINKQPSWLLKKISLHARNMPLNLMLSRLLRISHVVINYDNSVKPERLVSINYSGTIKGALDILAAETNYHYVIQPYDITWSGFMTKTFNISFMPGSSNYLVGQQQNNSGNETTQSSNSGSSLIQLNDQQYSNLKGELSLWDDINNTLKELKSPEGKIMISESTTTVTVRDHPSNVRAIADYISDLNKRLSLQVAIKVQVLEIQLNKDFNYGINWNAILSTLGTHFNLIGNLGQATNITQNALVLQGGTSPAASLKIGNPGGAQTLINALSRQGKVRVITQPQLVTMNNQIASIRITRNVGYVESVSQSLNQNFVTTSVTPGSITDGFTLYVLPKIQRNKVFMQISSTIANLENLQKVSTASNDSGNSSSSNQQQFEAIQVPTLAQKAFNQRSVVTSGSTLVIAGYKRLHDATDEANLFGIEPLGGVGAQTQNTETLVLITPIILHSSKSNVDINEG